MYCHECVAMSGRLSYALRRYNKPKLEEIIDIFTKHWNEKHNFSRRINGIESMQYVLIHC